MNRLLRALWSFCLIFTVGTLFANPFVVTIDAGHGGKDPGAIGSFAKEKDINLAIALKLGHLIEQNCPDVRVVYTRKTDVFIPLEERAMIANNAHSNLFICIHTNSSPNPAASGAETYTLGLAKTEANMNVARRENSVILLENNYKEKYQGFNPNSVDSYIMFEYMQDKYLDRSIQFATDVQQKFISNAERADRGVRQAGFWVLHQTAMPAVLIEVGYISNTKEEAFLSSSEGQEKAAKSIFEAFLAFKKDHDKKSFTRFTTNNASVQSSSSKTKDSVSTTILKADTESIAKQTQLQPLPPKKKSATITQTATSMDKPNKQEVSTIVSQEPIFKIQFLLSDKPINMNNKLFKGLDHVSFYKENNYYKYTTGDTSSYREIVKEQYNVRKRHPTAFIVAFINDRKVTVREAIQLWEANQKKLKK
ncbi:MAG: N-acetylmuramoyl-L-alanine amidase family protein [Microbacter sp.]